MMDIGDISGTCIDDSLTTTETTITSDVLAKLRRLKIQESIFSASLEKSNFDEENHIVDLNHNLDWKMYSSKVRNNVTEIKNMFEDIKIATNDSQDNLKNINIEEIKKDILNLNGKIKSLEDFINTELKLLRSKEKELLKQMSEEPKLQGNTKGKVKIYSKQYNEVVPSPVRVLINSPLKCTEVQQFQAFMSKSKNRYGGWNEYNHNIFIQIWNKFYATDDIVSVENNMEEINHDKLLPQFKDEVYEKIPGIQLEDIMVHSKWFSQYCYLKRAQQIALDKWRDNKRKIKGRQGKVKNNVTTLQNSNDKKTSRKQKETCKYPRSVIKELSEDHQFERNPSSFDTSNTSRKSSLQLSEELFDTDRKVPIKTIAESREQIVSKLKCTFSKPTVQWINRCNDNGRHEGPPYDSDIEKVDKLCIPNWRWILHKNIGINESK